MDLSSYVNALRDDFTTAAAAGDEQTRRTAAVLGAALEPAARLAIMNALSELAAEVTAALGDRVVEVRLDGREVRVAVSGAAAEQPEPSPASSPFGVGTGPDAGDISRITLRLVDEIKSRAERAASAQGVSLNSWVSQAVQGALAGRPRGSEGSGSGTGRGDRVRGWVQG